MRFIINLSNVEERTTVNGLICSSIILNWCQKALNCLKNKLIQSEAKWESEIVFFQQNHPFYTRGELQTPAAAVWSRSYRSFTQQEFWSYDSVSFCGFLFFSSLFYKPVLSLTQTCNNVFLQFAYCGLEAASLWKNTRTPASLSSCCESLLSLSTVPAQKKKGSEGSRMPARVFLTEHSMS